MAQVTLPQDQARVCGIDVGAPSSLLPWLNSLSTGVGGPTHVESSVMGDSAVLVWLSEG